MVDATHWPELLEDMAIVDGDNNYIEGVSMNGSIETVTDRHFVVSLDAARKSLRFPRNKVRRLVAADAVADHWVVVDRKIVVVKGLHLPADPNPVGYHYEREGAVKELEDIMSKLPPEPATSSTPVTAAAAASSQQKKPRKRSHVRQR